MPEIISAPSADAQLGQAHSKSPASTSDVFASVLGEVSCPRSRTDNHGSLPLQSPSLNTGPIQPADAHARQDVGFRVLRIRPRVQASGKDISLAKGARRSPFLTCKEHFVRKGVAGPSDVPPLQQPVGDHTTGSTKKASTYGSVDGFSTSINQGSSASPAGDCGNGESFDQTFNEPSRVVDGLSGFVAPGPRSAAISNLQSANNDPEVKCYKLERAVAGISRRPGVHVFPDTGVSGMPISSPTENVSITPVVAQTPGAGVYPSNVPSASSVKASSVARNDADDSKALPPLPAAQLSQAVAGLHLRADGSSRLTLQLAPESLGQVHLLIARDIAGNASVDVHMDRAETLASLKADLPHLHQALDRAGVPEQRNLTLHLISPQDAAFGSIPSRNGDGGHGRGGQSQPESNRRGALSTTADGLVEAPPPSREPNESHHNLPLGLNITA